MTPDQVVRAWFDQVWTQGNESAIDRLMAPTATIHDLPLPAGNQGPVAFKPFFQKFRAALPDVRIEVLRTITEGDLVAAHCRVTATHRGDALGIPASHRRVEFFGIAIARVHDDQIVEGWNAFDFLSLYQQLQLLPTLTI